MFQFHNLNRSFIFFRFLKQSVERKIVEAPVTSHLAAENILGIGVGLCC